MRSFSDDPRIVGQYGIACIEGLRDADFHLTPTVLYSRRTNELNPDAVLQLPPETAEEEAPVPAAA